MAKHVLMVAYYFPPLGMGGVQRMAKLAKYLPEFGYDVSVLTVKPISYPAYDYSLLEELPLQVKVYRSGSADPARLARLFHFPLARLSRSAPAMKRKGALWPDSKTGWQRPALHMAEKIHGQHPIDVVLSSSPPITAHLIAKEIKLRYRVPWVADFRDLWESYAPEKLYDDQGLIKKSYGLLSHIAATADAVTSINQTIGRRITEKAATIVGGYDPDDFALLPEPTPHDDFMLCYMGTIGSLHPIEPYFAAAALAAGRNRSFAQRCRFLIIGANDESGIRKAAAPYGWETKITITGYLPHKEALGRASGASVLLLSIPPDYPDLLTGKVFDCLALGRPLLASAPLDGEAVSLITSRHGGCCAPPGDMHHLAEMMLKLFEKSQSGQSEKADLSGLTRRDVARQFAGLFDRVSDATR